MKELTVVPSRNSYTPEDAHVGYPSLFSPPKGTRINISCTFTWDLEEAYKLHNAWFALDYDVLLGGPAFDDPGGEFTPGKFVKKGITITSRGCPRECPWCYVPKREGNIRELKIQPGYIIQDNNLLACKKSHIRKVFEMLKTQFGIQFKGGIDSRLLKDWHIEAFKGLSIKEIWLASDSKGQLGITQKAINKLVKAGFTRNKIRCYVLVGYNGETQDEAEFRLRELYLTGCLPFAQFYDMNPNYKEWQPLIRRWSRPAAIKSYMKGESNC